MMSFPQAQLQALKGGNDKQYGIALQASLATAPAEHEDVKALTHVCSRLASGQADTGCFDNLQKCVTSKVCCRSLETLVGQRRCLWTVALLPAQAKPASQSSSGAFSRTLEPRMRLSLAWTWRAQALRELW